MIIVTDTRTRTSARIEGRVVLQTYTQIHTHEHIHTQECELKADKSDPGTEEKLITQAIGVLLVIHTLGDFYDMN